MRYLLLFFLHFIFNNAYCLEIYTVSVNQFGAKGTDKVDDTKAIQNALDHLNKKGGGTLLFPKGTYIVSRQHYTKEATCLIVYSNISIKGEGDQSIIKLNGSQPNFTRMVNVVSRHNIEFTNLSFDGNYLEQINPTKPFEHLHAIFINSSSDVKISKCTFKKMGGDGVYIMGPKIQSNNVTITNCSFDDNQRNGITLGSGFRNIIIKKNYFGKKIKHSPIDTEPNGGKCEDLLIEENVIETNNLLTLGGVSSDNLGRNQIVRNNILKNCSIFIIYADNIKIENNVIDGSNKKAAITVIRTSTNVLIKDNKIESNTLSAIDIIFSKNQIPRHVVVESNTFTHGTLKKPCLLVSGGDDITFKSNNFNSKINGTSLLTLKVSRSMKNLYFTNNKVKNFSSNVILKYSSDNTITNLNIVKNIFYDKQIKLTDKELSRIFKYNIQVQ